jgi:hypothetical protein
MQGDMPAAFARVSNTQKGFFSQVAWLLLAPVHVRAWQRRQGWRRRSSVRGGEAGNTRAVAGFYWRSDSMGVFACSMN